MEKRKTVSGWTWAAARAAFRIKDSGSGGMGCIRNQSVPVIKAIPLDTSNTFFGWPQSSFKRLDLVDLGCIHLREEKERKHFNPKRKKKKGKLGLAIPPPQQRLVHWILLWESPHMLSLPCHQN